MIEDTIADRLRHYGIGTRIKALRVAKGIGLVELGRHSGLSAGLLSKIERDLMIPPLPTLLRIAMVFGVGLEHFFNQLARPRAVVVRKRDRLRLPDDPRRGSPAYLFESLDYPATDQPMEAYLAEFHSISSPHSHFGPELIYVTKGKLTVELGDEVFDLSAGDSMNFDPTYPHTYRPRDGAISIAVIVVSRNSGLHQPGIVEAANV